MTEKSKLGPRGASIFARTPQKNEQTATAPKTTLPIVPQEPQSTPEPVVIRIGRPPKYGEEKPLKVTVSLLRGQVVFLDRLSADLLARSGKTVKRSDLIQALILTLEEAGAASDPTVNLEQIKASLLRRLKPE